MRLRDDRAAGLRWAAGPRSRVPGAWAAATLVVTALFATSTLAIGVAPAAADAGTTSNDVGASSIGFVVLLLVAIGVAYLAAHFLVDRLQRRLLVLSGAEYLFLGILLGPLVPEIRAFDELTPLMPFVALAAGWVGLLRGTELQVRRQEPAPTGTVRVVLAHHLVSGGVVAVGAWFFLTGPFVQDAPWEQLAIATGVLACCAAVDSAAPISLLSRRYELSGNLVTLLRRSALLGDMLIIFVFGLLFCVFHASNSSEAFTLRPTEWAVVSVGLGVVLGLLFTAFLVGDESPNGRFLALVGIITFACGAAWYMRLDPLLVNMTLGVVLVNTARGGHLVRHTLENTHRPMALVLLVLAGALWRPPEPVAALVGAGGFVLLRALGKMAGSLVTALGTPLRRDLFRGLFAHGEVTVAMAVSFRLVYEGPAVDLAYSVILTSVVLNDLVAPRLLRSLLVDAGEIRGEGARQPEAEQEAR